MGKLSGHGFTEGGLSLIPLSVTSSSEPKDLIYKQIHGIVNNKTHKVILLFGDDLACKTSLKDAFVNYIYQTQIKDTHRLALIDESAMEKDPRIKVYIFYASDETILPFNLVLIDVPPLGGLHSAEGDVRTLQSLERFLQEEFKSSRVNAVNLVAPSSMVFFRPFINTYNLLNYSFDRLDSLAQILVTNAPAHMPFISSLRKVKLAFNSLFTFYTENQAADDEGEQILSQIYLHYDFPGVEDFFLELKSVPPSLMSLVRKVESGLVVPADISRLRIVNQFSETRGRRYSLSYRQLCMKSSLNDEPTGFQILTLGKKNDRQNRIIVLVGDKFSGKTTITTVLVNRLFGVKFQDTFRLLVDDELVNRFGKEDDIRASNCTMTYVFNSIPGLRTDYNFILVDSIGFGTSEEKTYNKTAIVRLAKILKRLYKTKDECYILFMAPEMTNSLPDSYKVLHKRLQAFVHNNMENFMFLDAFAPSKKSPVPKAIKKLESTQVKLFKYDQRNQSAEAENSKERSKSQEFISDLNWNIEHCTLEKLFRRMLS